MAQPPRLPHPFEPSDQPRFRAYDGEVVESSIAQESKVVAGINTTIENSDYRVVDGSRYVVSTTSVNEEYSPVSEKQSSGMFLLGSSRTMDEKREAGFSGDKPLAAFTQEMKVGQGYIVKTNITIDHPGKMELSSTDSPSILEINDRHLVKQVHEIMSSIAKDGKITEQESDRMFNLQQDLRDDGRLNNSVPNVVTSNDKPLSR